MCMEFRNNLQKTIHFRLSHYIPNKGLKKGKHHRRSMWAAPSALCCEVSKEKPLPVVVEGSVGCPRRRDWAFPCGNVEGVPEAVSFWKG